jgi:FAD/FMN-containing dehydrogenase
VRVDIAAGDEEDDLMDPATRRPRVATDVAPLRRGFDGQVLLPGEDGYDQARQVWNAIAAVDDDATAFSHRDALVEFVGMASWTDPAEDEARITAARRYGAAVEPFASGVYVNDLTDEGEAGVRRANGADNLARLTTLKDRYDPDNVFHLNHNIRPSSTS